MADKSKGGNGEGDKSPRKGKRWRCPGAKHTRHELFTGDLGGGRFQWWVQCTDCKEVITDGLTEQPNIKHIRAEWCAS
jgi:hypothetical protein